MHITVLGRHHYVTTADLGRVTLMIDTAGRNATPGTTPTAGLVDAVTADLRRLSASPERATWRQVGPFGEASAVKSTRARSGQPRPTGAPVRVEARFTDPDALVTFLNRWAAQPDVQVSDVTWEVSRDRRASHDDRALTLAIADAYRRARAIARAAGASDVEALAFGDPPSPTPQGVEPGVGTDDARAATRGTTGTTPPDIGHTVVIEGRFRSVGTGPTVDPDLPAAPRRALI